MGVVVEVLIVSSESEPSAGEAVPRSHERQCVGTCSGKAPVEEKVARMAIASATYKGSFWPWKDKASWRTRGTAIWVRRAREGSGMETGPTGGSVVEDARVERSTSEKTSLHQATLSAGSCVGCCTIGAAAWSWASTGRGAVSEGSTGIGPWVGSEMTSSFSLCTVCSTRCGRGAIIWIGAASSTSYRLGRLYISFCARSVAGRGGSGGGGGISPGLIGVYDAYGRGGTGGADITD